MLKTNYININMIILIINNVFRGAVVSFLIFALYKELDNAYYRNHFFIHDKLHKIYENYSFFIEKINQLMKLNPLYDNIYQDNEDNKEIDEKEDISSLTTITKYEDKYLAQVRQLSEDYVFTEDEENIMNIKFHEFHKEALEFIEKNKNRIKQELSECQQELSDIENMEFSEDETEITYDDDDETTPLSKKSTAQQKEYYTNKVNVLKEELLKINDTIVKEDDVKKQARDFVIKERLDKLKNCFVMEKTPLGNVIMLYNNNKESFEYYSDNTIPYRYLEVVGRKYVISFNCRPLYVDMEKELEKYEKLLQEKEEDNKRKQEELEKITANKDSSLIKKNVFTKFKSYNKDAGSGRVNKAPPPKNSIPNNQQNKNPNEKVLLKERSNHYTCEGRFSNFNILKKVDRKIVDKKYAMSFGDFKKSSMYSKIKNC